ncbi:DUF6452 family protein [Flavobacterium pedocola]
MKKLKIVALSILLANSFWSCEKDDICAEGTPTTPNVVIEFYDAANPTSFKLISNLRIKDPALSTYIDLAGGTKIKVPLKVNADETTLQFIRNGSDTDNTNDNIDVLTFNYAREDVYISRACGFKTVFQLNADSPTLTDGDAGMWIQSRTITQSNIQNENETHIKIYF